MTKNKVWLLAVVSVFLLLFVSACGNNNESANETNENDNNSGNENVSENNNDGNSGEVGVYEPLDITFSHNQPLESPEHAGAAKFKELMEERSGGQISVEVFPAQQLGGLRDQVESTQIGEIDITMQPSAVVTPFVDGIKALDLPYLWPPNYEHMYEVLDSEAGDDLLATLDTGGFKGLGHWPGGFKLFTTGNLEIHLPEDFQGVTMRTMESPALLAQYEGWGGNPIPVPYAEVYNALQQGIVDGQENPLQTIYLNNYHEVQDYVIESYHGIMSYVLMANKNWFDSLPEDTQALIIEVEEEAKNTAREALNEMEDGFRQDIIDSGVTYYELTDEEIQAFQDASLPIHEEIYSTPEQVELLQRIYDKIDEVTGD